MESDRDVYSHPPSSTYFSEKDHDRHPRRSKRSHTVSSGGRTIASLRFSDDSECFARGEEELAKLAERLDKASTACSMEISAEKTSLVKSNTCGINRKTKINGQKVETVTSFKYLGSVLSDEGSNPEILSRIAQTLAALRRFKPVWNDRSISLGSKILRTS